MPRERVPLPKDEKPPEIEFPKYFEDEASGIRLRYPELDKEKIAQYTDAKNKVGELHSKLDDLYSDEPAVKEREPEKKSAEETEEISFMEKLRRSKLAKTLLVAFGLHLPATPEGKAVIDETVRTIRGVELARLVRPDAPRARISFDDIKEKLTNWNQPNMVLRPQSEEERKEAIERVYEMGERSDAAGNEKYKAKIAKKLEAGKGVGLGEMYQEIAKLSGEDPARVKEAMLKKNELVKRLAARMGNKLDDVFVRSVVDEMFGPSSNYEFKQGSATEYFVTGKRNCEAIAYAEQMVFEELIKRLPEEQRNSYELGMAFEKQHQIATLTFKRKDGSIDHTLYLQPPTEALKEAKERTGSPTVSLETIKKAMVSKEPIVVKAPEKPGDKVEDSPDLDIVTNSPINLGLKIEGKLRGSDYVRRVAEERGVEPERAEPKKEPGVMELELLKKGPEIEEATEEVKGKIILLKNALGQNVEDSPDAYLELKRVNDVEQLKLLRPKMGNVKLEVLYIGDWETGMGTEEARELDKVPAKNIWFLNKKKFPSALKELVAVRAKMSIEEQRRLPVLGFSRLETVKELNIPEGSILESIRLEIDPMYLRVPEKMDSAVQGKINTELSEILNISAKNIFLKGYFIHMLTGPHLQFMDLEAGKNGQTFFIEAGAYLNLLLDYPKLASCENLRPWVDNATITDEYRDNEQFRGDKSVQRVLKLIESESKKKFARGWISI